jgi:hypothetical protein
MALVKKSNQDKEDERQLKILSGLFQRKGIEVRREKLARGAGFRVKSGNCLFSGDDLLFLDRRLPLKQQLSVMIDWLIEKDIELSDSEMEELPSSAKTLLARRVANA